jgi:hypothetical protein
LYFSAWLPLVTLAVLLLPTPPRASAQPNSGLPHNIPNFCANATISSVKNGPWSSASTWQPARVPRTGDTVSISSSTVVTYDQVSNENLDCVGINGTLAFSTSANTRLKVGTLMVMASGTLEVGRPGAPVGAGATAEIIIANHALDTTVDPEQYGTGLVGFGVVRMHGAVRSPTFTRLAAEPSAGTSSLSTSDPLTGWQAGDRLIIPDTRHLKNNEVGSAYQPQWEELVVANAGGRSIGLSSPLQYDHLGARDATGALDFLPHVGNLTRNVVIRSENPSGTRGHVIFTGHADVDIRYVLFSDLGRTTSASLNNTTFDSSGRPTKIGTNQIGRYALHMHHLMGPSTPPATGYQYMLIGNAIERGTKWALAIHNTHYGLVRENVMYDMQGAVLMTEDGSESENVIERNFAMRTHGTGGRQGGGRQGTGFYFRGPNNYVRLNVAANISSDGPDSAYGFLYFLEYLGNIKVPKFPGADTSVSGQYTQVDANAMPVKEFSDNEVYGATESGLTYWWIGAYGACCPRANVPVSTFRDLVIWHVYNKGIFHYPSSNITFDGLTIRGQNPGQSACCSVGWAGSDYMGQQIVIRRADISGVRIGVHFSTANLGPAPHQLVEDSQIAASVAGVSMPGLWHNSSQSDGIKPRRVELRNVRFSGPGTQIRMDFSPAEHKVQLDELVVTQHNGVAGDNFQVFYPEQAPTFVVPQTKYNTNGTSSIVGAPVAGLTNAQTWAQYGIAIAGGVAPCSTTRPGIVGFVCPHSGSTPPPSVPPPAAPTGLRITP